MVETNEATEVVIGGSAPVLITCEHASNRMPEPWQWPGEDLWLVEQHWAWDPGAAEASRRLAMALGGVAVLSRFSRLLVDPNRPLDAPTLFRDVADGRRVHLNPPDGADRARRIAGYYEPYHAMLAHWVQRLRPRLVLGMHSYTPLYEGSVRKVELGVLYCEGEDRHLCEGRAQRWRDAYEADGWDARLNEPWSGLEGLMYSPDRHAREAGCPALELEIRQDLLARDDRMDLLVARTAALVREEIGLTGDSA